MVGGRVGGVEKPNRALSCSGVMSLRSSQVKAAHRRGGIGGTSASWGAGIGFVSLIC